MTTEIRAITQEAYLRLQDHKKNVDAYEIAFREHANEIATLMNYGHTARVTFFGDKYVIYSAGYHSDDRHQFKVELLWDPDYKKTIAEFHEEIRRQCKARAAASETAEKERTEKFERAELERLKKKYPNG